MKVRQRRPRDAGSVVVRKRKDGSDSYMLKWRAVTKTVPASSKREAMALLPAFVAEAQAGHVEAEREAARKRNEQPTLREWSEVFLAEHVTQDEDRLSTRITYGNVLRLYVLPELGGYRLHEITTPMIRQTLQGHYRAGRSISTLKLANAVLHRLFDAAIEDGHPITNPVPKFGKLRLGEGAPAADGAAKGALTREQVAALLAECEGDPALKLFAAIMVTAALRRGEALGLRWSHIDFKTGRLSVEGSAKSVSRGQGQGRAVWIGKTKNRSSVRKVFVGPLVVELLKAERERQEAEQREILGRDPSVRELRGLLPADACVFPAGPLPDELVRPFSPDAMGDRFQRASKRAGLDTRPHALRHTAISHAIDGGLSLADVAKNAGHANVGTTARTYVHSVTESQRKAALIGDSLLAAPEQQPNDDEREAGHK